MSDENNQEEKVKRPNANYQLSRKDQEDDNLTFYYSREKRLAKAPQAVRDLYNQKKPRSRFNLIGPLVNTKGNAMLFFTIIIIYVALLLIRILDPGGAYKLEGNRLTVQAAKHDGIIIVQIKKSLAKNRLGKQPAAYTGTVDIGVSPVLAAPDGEAGAAPDIFMHRIFFTANDTEEFRFTLPFESDSVIMVFQTEKNQLSVKVDVENKLK